MMYICVCVCILALGYYVYYRHIVHQYFNHQPQINGLVTCIMPLSAILSQYILIKYKSSAIALALYQYCIINTRYR